MAAVVGKFCAVFSDFTGAAEFPEGWGSDIHLVRENTPPLGNRVKRKT
jgi:hypothetical protein